MPGSSLTLNDFNFDLSLSSLNGHQSNILIPFADLNNSTTDSNVNDKFVESTASVAVYQDDQQLQQLQPQSLLQLQPQLQPQEHNNTSAAVFGAEIEFGGKDDVFSFCDWKETRQEIPAGCCYLDPVALATAAASIATTEEQQRQQQQQQPLPPDSAQIILQARDFQQTCPHPQHHQQQQRQNGELSGQVNCVRLTQPNILVLN